MTTRRSFLKTVSALGLSVLAYPAYALGWCRRPRLIINGVALEFPDRLDILIEVPAAGADMGPVTLTVTGGVLQVRNPEGAALQVFSDKQGGLELKGLHHAILIENHSPGREAPPAIALRYDKIDGLTLLSHPHKEG